MLAACADCGRSVCSLCARFEAGQASCPEHGRHRQVGPSLQEMGVKQFSGPVSASVGVTTLTRGQSTTTTNWPSEVERCAEYGVFLSVAAPVWAVLAGIFIAVVEGNWAANPISMLFSAVMIIPALIGTYGGIPLCLLGAAGYSVYALVHHKRSVQPQRTLLLGGLGLLLSIAGVGVCLLMIEWMTYFMD